MIHGRGFYLKTSMSKFQTVHYTIDVPPAFWSEGSRGNEGVRIVFLTDLHNRTYGVNNEQLIAAIDREDPDLVLSAGDLITAKGGRCHVREGLRLVRNLAGRYPFYYVDGNHEQRMDIFRDTYGGTYDKMEKRMRSCGARPVKGCHEQPEALPVRLDICGFAPGYASYRRMHRAKVEEKDLREALREKKKDQYTILLAHHPDFFEAYAAWGADLILAGHLHGGIVRIPCLGGVCGATLRPFPGYDLGMYEKGTSRMIVSTGLGSHTIPLRINNPAQLIVIDLKRKGH